MARQIRSAKLDSRTARERIPTGSTIHYVDLGVDGADLGYRKGKTGGKWILRRYTGDKKYAVETIGATDDRADADGITVFSYRQAQEKARERHRALTRAETGQEDAFAGPYTVADAINDYLAHQDAEGGKSVKDSRQRANALIIPHLGKLELAKLSAAAVRKWLTSIATAPARIRTPKGKPQQFREYNPNDADDVRRRRATANRTLTILKAALNHAWREGKATSDEPWRRVKPFREVDAARVRYLTVDEARRLINAADPDFRNVIEAALQTGARYSELAALRVSDFNPDAGTVFVRASKSGKPRHIVLTDEGATLFRRLCAGRSPSSLILTRDDGGQWLKSHQVRPMHAAATGAGLGKDVTTHILRHTWASLSVMNGMPLIVVAQNMGHADTRMVEKHYGHLAPSYKADAVRANAPRFGVSTDNIEIMRSAR